MSGWMGSCRDGLTDGCTDGGLACRMAGLTD